MILVPKPPIERDRRIDSEFRSLQWCESTCVQSSYPHRISSVLQSFTDQMVWLSDPAATNYKHAFDLFRRLVGRREKCPSSEATHLICFFRQARRYSWRPGLIQIWFGQKGSDHITGSPHEATVLIPGFMLAFETAAPEVLLADLVKSSIVTVRKAMVALEVPKNQIAI